MTWYPTLDDIEAAAYAADTNGRFSHSWADNREPSTRAEPLSCGGCWCGGPNGHSWPGKSRGLPHPREERRSR